MWGFSSSLPLSKYRHDLKSIETNIHGYRKSIRKEEEKNEMLVTILNRSHNDANTTKKLIAQCLSMQEALKLESGSYTHILEETQQAVSRIKMVRGVTGKSNTFELCIKI